MITPVDATSSQNCMESSLVRRNAFTQLMSKPPTSNGSSLSQQARDLCIRPTAIYNEYYNPEAPVPDDLPVKYSPYVFG
jgi:hypothetical protein